MIKNTIKVEVYVGCYEDIECVGEYYSNKLGKDSVDEIRFKILKDTAKREFIYKENISGDKAEKRFIRNIKRMLTDYGFIPAKDYDEPICLKNLTVCGLSKEGIIDSSLGDYNSYKSSIGWKMENIEDYMIKYSKFQRTPELREEIIDRINGAQRVFGKYFKNQTYD